jgi:signal peptidase I
VRELPIEPPGAEPPEPIEPTEQIESASPSEAGGNTGQPGRPAPRRRWRRGGALFEILETLVLTVVIFLGIQAFVAQPYKIEQMSMENTLLPEQYVLVDKLTPRWAPYQRGDVVVFNPPPSWQREGKVPFIKRVIGLPGDHVEIRDGKVFVNDAELDEPYLFADGDVVEPTDPSVDGARSWVVPDGDLLVMGDHRQASVDSREHGPIPISAVIGRAWLRYWPVDTFEVLAKPSYAAIPPP